ncbi:hypothetical protein PTI98_000249 [Pleurotus ostreatus]|nr:hypothetical protein PTI98_000249 [Pleurotus ostreatus]
MERLELSVLFPPTWPLSASHVEQVRLLERPLAPGNRHGRLSCFALCGRASFLLRNRNHIHIFNVAPLFVSATESTSWTSTSSHVKSGALMSGSDGPSLMLAPPSSPSDTFTTLLVTFLGLLAFIACLDNWNFRMSSMISETLHRHRCLDAQQRSALQNPRETSAPLPLRFCPGHRDAPGR